MTKEELEKEGYQDVLGMSNLFCKRSSEHSTVWFNLTTQQKIEVQDNPAFNKPLIHPTAQIGENVEIGEGTYIGPFCIIGYPAEHKGYWDKPVGKVIIGKNCVITGHVTIDAGTEGITWIGDNCWLLKHSHVGHDAHILDDVTISCGAKIGGHATIGRGTNIGLNACIHQRLNVPYECMIGMNAAVTKKLEMKPQRKYAGVPAKDIGSNIRE